MSWLLPVAFVIGTWAWATGRWRRIRFADILAIAAGLLAVRLATQGEWLPALVGFGWAGGWFRHRRREQIRRGAVRRARPAPPAAPRPAGTAAAEAAALLGLPAAADAGMIRAAHRRLIRRVHPDTGGAPDLAYRVNAARDTLLAELNRNASRAS